MVDTHPLRHSAGAPLYLSGGSIESYLTYEEDWALPNLAAFPLLDSSSGRLSLQRYYENYMHLAELYKTGIVLETPTLRASTHWGDALGYDAPRLNRINQDATACLARIKTQHASATLPVLIAGTVGTAGEAHPARRSTCAAVEYHSPQIAAFASAGVDLIIATDMTSSREAIGIAYAAHKARIEVAISLRIAVDGNLAGGETLDTAILEVLHHVTPAYLMVHGTDPATLSTTVLQDAIAGQINAVRCDASGNAHLTATPDSDAADPRTFAQTYEKLYRHLPNLRVMGGGCGIGERHMGAAAALCLQPNPASESPLSAHDMRCASPPGV